MLNTVPYIIPIISRLQMDFTQSLIQLLFFNIKELVFLVHSISNGCFPYFLTLLAITMHFYPNIFKHQVI